MTEPALLHGLEAADAAVDAGHRRQGLARHLLEAGLDRLAEAGADRLEINFANDNPASGRLYASLGFTTEMTTSILVWDRGEEP